MLKYYKIVRLHLGVKKFEDNSLSKYEAKNRTIYGQKKVRDWYPKECKRMQESPRGMKSENKCGMRLTRVTRNRDE